MLQTKEELRIENFRAEAALVEGAYKIAVGERLNIEIFTNKGERVLDPNLEIAVGQAAAGMQMRPESVFTVLPNGEIILPLLGSVQAEGLSLVAFQNKLVDAYSDYYIEPFLRISPVNRRAVVLGAPGGQVIPLENEPMNLLEVLAAAGGLERDARASNIRLVRGPLDNPSVQIIDLSTIDGMKKANMVVLPNDIIYVEPVRRVFNESLRDIAPLVGVITNLATLFIVIQSLN